MGLGEEQQRLGLDSAHAKALRGGQGKPGVAGELAELEPPVVCGRQLKVQHGGGAEGPGLGGGAASVAQAFGPAELEQLDGAQLVQCPQPPERKVPGLGDGQGALKRAARAVSRSCSRAIRPITSSAWHRTSGLAPAESRAACPSFPACRHHRGQASSAPSTAICARPRSGCGSAASSRCAASTCALAAGQRVAAIAARASPM